MTRPTTPRSFDAFLILKLVPARVSYGLPIGGNAARIRRDNLNRTDRLLRTNGIDTAVLSTTTTFCQLTRDAQAALIRLSEIPLNNEV